MTQSAFRSDLAVLIPDIEARYPALLRELEALLVQKNEAYGDSVLNPSSELFEVPDPEVLIKVRLTDKLSRIRRGQFSDDESKVDTLMDAAGYFLLWVIHERRKAETRP